MAENPRFTVCVLDTETIERDHDLSWMLDPNCADRYDLGPLSLSEQFELGADLDTWVRDGMEDLEETRREQGDRGA